MKLSALLFSGLFILGMAGISQAQTQVNNSGFEDWENLGSATEEPVEWSSFKTASGPIAYLASQQIKRSPVIRPGSGGSYSCVIWSKSIIGIIANGVLTNGQINMGSSTATDPSNYNITHTSQTSFSEALGASPDSLVFWTKFVPSNSGGTDSARVRTIIHDTYDYRDPSTSDASAPDHVVAEATLHYASTGNQWVRLSIPFIYTGPATSPDYILITFTTNKTPGEGSGGDSLYVDDLELIYNDNGILNINSSENVKVYTDASDVIINFSFDKPVMSEIAVYNIYGQAVYTTQITAQNTQKHIAMSQFKKGIYIVDITTDDGHRFSQKVSLN